jgi:hypothetical protein
MQKIHKMEKERKPERRNNTKSPTMILLLTETEETAPLADQGAKLPPMPQFFVHLTCLKFNVKCRPVGH